MSPATVTFIITMPLSAESFRATQDQYIVSLGQALFPSALVGSDSSLWTFKQQFDYFDQFLTVQDVQEVASRRRLLATSTTQVTNGVHVQGPQAAASLTEKTSETSEFLGSLNQRLAQNGLPPALGVSSPKVAAGPKTRTPTDGEKLSNASPLIGAVVGSILGCCVLVCLGGAYRRYVQQAALKGSDPPFHSESDLVFLTPPVQSDTERDFYQLYSPAHTKLSSTPVVASDGGFLSNMMYYASPYQGTRRSPDLDAVVASEPNIAIVQAEGLGVLNSPRTRSISERIAAFVRVYDPNPGLSPRRLADTEEPQEEDPQEEEPAALSNPFSHPWTPNSFSPTLSSPFAYPWPASHAPSGDAVGSWPVLNVGESAPEEAGGPHSKLGVIQEDSAEGLGLSQSGNQEIESESDSEKPDQVQWLSFL